MDLSEYRENDTEQERIQDIIGYLKKASKSGGKSLEIGARDGYITKILAKHFEKVTALDLEKPNIPHENIQCVQGEVSNLEFEDSSFDFVCCTEVLEHIPPHILKEACSELSRVTRDSLLIGVPYKQDIRVGRTTCGSCGKINPPWGHINSFDKPRLMNLFPSMSIENISFVGENNVRTNFISSFLMDLAGNPYGIYEQEEGCLHCGGIQIAPQKRTFLQKVYSKLAVHIVKIQKPFTTTHPNWIHIHYKKLTI